MIKKHDLNSAWWGKPVAIITDVAWFDQPSRSQQESLACYAWAEFKAPLVTAPPARHFLRAGFALTDTQVNFRIRLGSIKDSPSLSAYECRSAVDQPFSVDPENMRPFAHERFSQIPGVTEALLTSRYGKWSNEILARHPEWCLQLTHQGRVQGWFLSEPDGPNLHLVLAILSADAEVSGQHLYHRALVEYAKRGASIGHAAFSVTNTSVLNIYAQLGARFLPPTGCWIWIPP
jgi:hypothetical protein